MPSLLQRVKDKLKEEVEEKKRKAKEALEFAKQGAQRVRRTPAKEFLLPTSTKGQQGLSSLAKILQMAPDTTIRTKPVLQPGQAGFQFEQAQKGFSEFVTSIPGEQVKSYGRTLDRILTPEGRQQLAQSSKRVVTSKPSLETLGEPATEDVLNLTDILPGGIFFTLGVKGLSKQGTKKIVREVAETTAKKEATKLGTREATEKLVVGGGKYSTKRFTLSEGLDNFMRNTAKDIEPEIEAARRGTRTWQQTLKDSDKITIADILARQKGQAVNDAYTAAATNHLKNVSDEISNLTEAARKLEETGKPSVAIKNEIAKQVTLYKALMAQTLGATSESGRALNAARIYARNLDKPREVLIKNVLKNAGDYKNVDFIVDKLMTFADDDKQGMIKFLSQAKPSDLASKIEAVWYNNILSAPSSHIANTIGNLGRSIWHLSSKPVRVGSDIIASKISGKPREEFMREFGPELIGSVQGLRTGLHKAIEALTTGIRSSDVEKLRVPTTALKGRLGGLYSTPTRLLLAEDDLFRGITRQMDLHRAATNKAIKEGLKDDAFAKRTGELIAGPTPDMIKHADELADELLFMKGGQELLMTGGLRDLIKIKLPVLGELRPMRFFVPFVTTPINILKFAAEASPVGLGATLAGAKGMDRLTLNRKVASGIMGSIVYATLASYVMEDKVTGRPPTNKTERDAFYAQGKQPYAIKIGDKWYQYNRMPEPIATALTSISAMHDAFNQSDEVPTHEKIQDGVLGIARSFSDRSFLSGLGDLLDALESPDQRGKKSLQRLFASATVPFSSASGAIARALDRTVRQPETYAQARQAIIPGQSKNVPALESKFEEGGATRKYPSFQEFLPIKTTQETDNPEARKYMSQQEFIKEQESKVQEQIRATDIYGNASDTDKLRLEDGAMQSFRNAVGKEKGWSISSYVKNQSIVDVYKRTTRKRTRQKRERVNVSIPYSLAQ